MKKFLTLSLVMIAFISTQAQQTLIYCGGLLDGKSKTILCHGRTRTKAGRHGFNLYRFNQEMNF